MDNIDRVLIKAVLDTTVDQLAVVGGTLASKTASAASKSSLSDPVDFIHPNQSDSSLEEILLSERKMYLRRLEASNKKNGNLTVEQQQPIKTLSSFRGDKTLALKCLQTEVSYVQAEY